jgi:hypothetical protein
VLGKKYAISPLGGLRRIRAVHGVGVDRLREIGRGSVPLSAFFGSVAPISSRFFRMALSPSSTDITTGPLIMKSTRSLKNGRALWTA